MTKDNPIIPANPAIFTRGGILLVNSLEVAKHFDKRHDNVLRDIDDLIKSEPELAKDAFKMTMYLNHNNGQTYRAFDMDEPGFALLVMGFTGSKALKEKIRFTKQFMAMKAALEKPVVVEAPPVFEMNLRDPSQLIAFTQHLAVISQEFKDRAEAAETQLAIAAPKAEFYDEYADSKGFYCLQNAGRVLGLSRDPFMAALRAHGYLFEQGGNTTVPREDLLNKGTFVVRAFTRNGHAGQQTLVTAKGLQWLGRLVGKMISKQDIQASLNFEASNGASGKPLLLHS